MASKPPTQRTQKPNLPPKRGRVKAQIFGSFAETVSSVVSKAGDVLAKIKGSNGAAGSDSSTASPPPSGYASDAYSDRI
ncbi:Hypothetical predicted protein [Olea europaea subsp. europaea]|uniref:Uncharacterized protein n=1 Tax=Olea europaea subsp. europaea TaxID=158383 RepID=A0A8S0SJQ1_OLEEU|nr:Hypothetical predicted protein [Olea europaea subsp. europaea]